jgi:hypothetical protein
MGRFTKAEERPGWRPDGTGVTSGGDCGGDDQRGGSYSVRFVRDDLPGSMITVSFYVIERGPWRYGVDHKTEWMVCADPANRDDTEIWSDESYDAATDEVYTSPVTARAEARDLAQSALDDADAYADWDGQPDYGRAV